MKWLTYYCERVFTVLVQSRSLTFNIVETLICNRFSISNNCECLWHCFRDIALRSRKPPTLVWVSPLPRGYYDLFCQTNHTKSCGRDSTSSPTAYCRHTTLSHCSILRRPQSTFSSYRFYLFGEQILTSFRRRRRKHRLAVKIEFFEPSSILFRRVDLKEVGVVVETLN